MNDSATRPTRLVMVLSSLWTLAFAVSYWLLLATELEGSGFTRGLNRVEHFFGWQFAALVLAMASWLTAARRKLLLSRSVLWSGRVPLLAMLVELVALVLVIIVKVATRA